MTAAQTFIADTDELYAKPLESVFSISLREAKRSIALSDEMADALKDYFMMGALTAINILMTGHTFPNGQEVCYSANELCGEAMALLKAAAGHPNDDDEEDD